MTVDDTIAGLALFPTPLGSCGIAWSNGLVRATQLPEPTMTETRSRLVVRAGNLQESDPPPFIQRAIAAITGLLSGDPVDLSFIACDYDRTDPFQADVYRVARTIVRGETLTYGDIAMRLGNKLLAQQVGQALGRNPFPIIAPCHRVVGANGRLTGFSANGGLVTKMRMLDIEGAAIGGAPTLFDSLPLVMKPQKAR